MVVLGQQGGNAQADVACAGHSDLDIFEITHIFDYFFLQNNFETDKSVCGEYKKNNLNNGDNLNNFVRQMNLSLGEVEKQLWTKGNNLNNVGRQMNLSWGKVEKQLEQRGQLEQRWETDESVL
ncbi:MAG TPA: hypothetical protein DCP79_02560 [Prevotella sp.]|nr:hypothetical protein [Prevotella sp.]